MFASIAVEGFADESAAIKLCRNLNIGITVIHNCRGKAGLDRRLAGFNAAAFYSDWLVLRDMDQDAECAPSLRTRLLPHPADRMTFRLVVREVESWLLADKEQFAIFFRVAESLIPSAPETLPNPKERLLSLISRSRSKEIKLDMLPRPGSGGREGPLYAARLAEFAERHWRPAIAAKSCESLARTIVQLRRRKAIAGSQNH